MTDPNPLEPPTPGGTVPSPGPADVQVLREQLAQAHAEAAAARQQAAAAEQEARHWRDEADRLLQAGRVASDWLWETDTSGRVTWMTEGVSALTGRPSSEEIGNRPLDLNQVRTDEYSASYAAYLAARAARRPFRDLVLDRETPQGMMTVSISGVPRFDEHGQFLGYRGATRNISAELRARDEARRAERLLQQTLEGVPAGVMISGPDDRILMANRRWRETIGRGLPEGCDTWEGVVRHHAYAGHYPEAVGREDEYIAWRLSWASPSPKPVELRWRDEWVMVADRLLPDGCVVHLAIYVTDRKRAESALARAEAAELASRSTSEFLSRMSHEMRTPLNAVIGFAELLRLREGARPDPVDHVQHILSAGRHLLGLINDVLDLQQVEQGALVLKPADLALQPLVQHVQAMLQPQAAQHGIAQQRHGLDGLHVRADEQRLRQVLLNLGSNAIKYNRAGGLLRWCAEAGDQTRVGIVIEDTGPGLAEDQLARLFRPFERLGRETSATEGSGLGLVIARRLVLAMGGELQMSSRVGHGTRAVVWLPRAPAPAAEVAAGCGAPAAATAEARAPWQVLYVEDNPVNALLFAEALRDEPGIRVRVAEHGEAALAIARDWRPDLLVIDRHLPGASGAQVLDRLRTLPGLQAVPAVMCSADALPGDLARARDEGFAGYWTKPLDVLRLGQAIEQMISPGPAAPAPR